MIAGKYAIILTVAKKIISFFVFFVYFLLRLLQPLELWELLVLNQLFFYKVHLDARIEVSTYL